MPAPNGGKTDALISMEEAIDLLKTTRSTFYRWLRDGRIKGMKVGRQWRFERGEIDRFLKGEAPRIEVRGDVASLIRTLADRAADLGAKGVDLPQDTEVQRAVKLMIEIALAMGASDFHLEPHITEAGQAKLVHLRYRVDGVLYPAADIDVRLLPALIEQFKTLCACSPYEKRLQDGETIFDLRDGKEPINVRFSFVPTGLGESMAGRIFRRGSNHLTLERMDYAAGDKEKLLRSLHAPWGLIVATGPRGNGKTTTLYACLSRLAGPECKVVTIEDPVEYFFPWMTQVQVNASEALTFPRVIRAFLRSAPNVIMIGELVDGEVVNLALTAALSGHLVMTTLHTDTAAKALKRMVEMGSQPFAVAQATKLIFSQRLALLLCPQCSQQYTPPGNLLRHAEELARRGGLEWEALPKAFRKPIGCKECKQTGYRGRTVIAEMLEVTGDMDMALRRGASADELQALAVSQGMTTLAADGIRRAADGETTLEEILRVLPLA